ncbi:MAG: aromatic ring-hydroxylating dioxygenase subunit alpha [Steroidobacteraceae bacterium]
MYINFWYPVARSQDLGRTPLKVRILAHDLVAFRDQAGHAAVLSDTCAHRGASLSAGKCKEDGTVQCPYHGWRFDARGVCTRIPSIGSKTRPPPRARVDAYPVEEKYGIVFAFLGDLPEASRPPIMAVDEHGTPEWRATVSVFDVDYHYERSVENALDPAHNEYVHPTHGYQGEREDSYTMMELRPFKDTEWGPGFLASFDAPPLQNPLMRRFRPTGGRMEAGSGSHGPNQVWTYINFSATHALRQYMFEAPIDEHRTRVFLLNERNLLFFRQAALAPLNRWLDRKVNERNAYIASQDIRVMNTVQPRLTPPSRTKELMMPADKCILQYRDKLDEFRRQGWKLDMPAVQAARARGDMIFAIPCPARRETRAWVLDEAPRLAPASSEKSAVLQVAG